jgi:CubicO group peptidase (beta-lactamase class C family)
VLQQYLEDAMQRPFAALAQAEVLQPLGMLPSLFAPSPPAPHAALAALVMIWMALCWLDAGAVIPNWRLPVYGARRRIWRASHWPCRMRPQAEDRRGWRHRQAGRCSRR